MDYFKELIILIPYLLVATLVTILLLSIIKIFFLNEASIRIGIPGDYTPFAFYKGSQLLGFDIDLLENKVCPFGKKIVYVKTTWQDMSADLTNGRFDMAAGGISMTEERKNNFSFSPPTTYSSKIVLTRCDKVSQYVGSNGDLDWSKIDNCNTRIIVNPGGTNQIFVIQNIKHAKIIVNQDNISIFHKIKMGSADIMITDNIEALHLARKKNKLSAINQPITGDKENLYIGFMIPKKKILLKRHMTNWMRRLHKKGQYKLVCRKWDITNINIF